MATQASIKKAIDELRTYGNYLGNQGSKQYFSFNDGDKNHYYEVTYAGTEPIKIDKLNVTFYREVVMDCDTLGMDYAKDIQFGGF